MEVIYQSVFLSFDKYAFFHFFEYKMLTLGKVVKAIFKLFILSVAFL